MSFKNVKKTVGIALTLTLTAVTVSAEQSSVGDVESSIEMRQQAFKTIENDTKAAKRQLNDRDVDWQGLLAVSERLVANSELLPATFVANSHQGSKAKESIWRNPGKFEQLLSEMREGYAIVLKASQSHDVDLAEKGLKTAQATCQSCHRTYRSRW
ncbi:TPA: cytochrome c [Vibrio vulnificus]|uniref:c-type cytochrome n=1 Tax=Vibrio vulnificus TaxID=672 RepID=UPI0009B5FF41|nr:cytochrome c [Vibrio vulnificus]AUL98581.1 hypothetical protein FORC54_4436 [Vibrio vulnificus]EGQ8076774.1 cytochrome c [Vibrio vulnificus]EGR9007479.1 cytochrome c [Vibrio vulnificus]EHG1327874.1 cytochrome c [Vibrio vulnificus]EHH1182284.1 cytochrome c [Vibrio vulnificus]